MQAKKILVHNPRFNFGERDTKVLKKKLNGVEISLTALEKIRDEKDRKDKKEYVVGYTKLKEYKEKSETTHQSGDKKKEDVVLRLENINNKRGYSECKAFDKKKFYHKVVGYLPVGIKGDEFVAVVKVRILPFILLGLLLLSMLFCFAMCDAEKDPDSPWKPIIQDFTDQWEDDEPTTAKQGEIDVQGFTAISADKDTGVAKVCLRNPEGNPCYFKFYIYTDNGILLYESDLVPPDKEITKVTLNTTFEGTKKGYVFIETHELETGNEMNKAKFDIDIIFK